MKKNFRKGFNTIYVYAFLTLFIGYFASINLFYHSHLHLNETIVHSHPYNTDANGNPTHSHTGNGFITIQFISTLSVLLVFSYFSLKAISQFVYTIPLKATFGEVRKRLYSLSQLRAPPLDLLS